jgi:hypothetical protein
MQNMGCKKSMDFVSGVYLESFRSISKSPAQAAAQARVHAIAQGIAHQGEGQDDSG